jgi:hypothetical protein
MFARPVRYRAQIEKYGPGRTPDDGDPDEVVTVEQWVDVDGSEITDEARIAALNAERDAEAAEES